MDANASASASASASAKMFGGKRTVTSCGAVMLVFLLLFGCFKVKWFEKPSASTNDALAEERAALRTTNRSSAFGAIIDCGSSGSRIYVYTWRTIYIKDQLLEIREVNSTVIRPGLSDYLDRLAEIPEYLRNLIDFASGIIPDEYHQETPLHIMCTAGMRKLQPVEQETILNAVRRFVKTAYRFEFDDHYAEVISGKQEAAYAWITANYLLDRFKPLKTMQVNDSRRCVDSNFVCIDDEGDFAPLERNSTGRCESQQKEDDASESDRTRCRLRTVGMAEMGGASMQIAYELAPVAMQTFRSAGALPPLGSENNYTVDIDLGCNESSNLKYNLYVATYLNYGANSARDRYNLAYLRGRTKRIGFTEYVNGSDPCLPKGATLSRLYQTSELPPYANPIYGLALDLNTNKSIRLIGTSNYEECSRRIRETIMRIRCTSCTYSGRTKRNHCSMTDNCTILANWQPSISFNRQPFYGFSDFYYRYTDLYNLKGNNYNESLFRRHNKEFCSKTYEQLLIDHNATLHKWVKNPFRGPRFAEAQLQSQCFQAVYDYLVLHSAFKFPQSYQNLTMAAKIGGSQLQWTVGAVLYKTRAYSLRYKSGERCEAGSDDADCNQQQNEAMDTAERFRWLLLEKNLDLMILAAFTLCCFIVGVVTYIVVGRAKRLQQPLRLRSSVVENEYRPAGYDSQHPPTSV